MVVVSGDSFWNHFYGFKTRLTVYFLTNPGKDFMLPIYYCRHQVRQDVLYNLVVQILQKVYMCMLHSFDLVNKAGIGEAIMETLKQNLGHIRSYLAQ